MYQKEVISSRSKVLNVPERNQILVIFVNFGISRVHKMAKNQNFQNSQVTFGKYHKWSNLAKFQGPGLCRSL